MTEVIHELDRRGLREFGVVTGVIFAALFGLFFPWVFETASPRWPWILALILVAWGLIAPESLRPVYRAWMKFGLLLSRITTPLILGIVFFLVVMPIGLVIRLRGRDPMRRKFDDAAPTYRIPSAKPKRENMERPF